MIMKFVHNMDNDITNNFEYLKDLKIFLNGQILEAKKRDYNNNS